MNGRWINLYTTALCKGTKLKSKKVHDAVEITEYEEDIRLFGFYHKTVERQLWILYSNDKIVPIVNLIIYYW